MPLRPRCVRPDTPVVASYLPQYALELDIWEVTALCNNWLVPLQRRGW